MSDLTKYSGNFVDFANKEFIFANDDIRKKFTGISHIEVSISSMIAFFPSEDDSVTVEIDSDEPDSFFIEQNFSHLTIKQKTSDNIVINNGNNVVIGNFNFNNVGKIYVNGVDVTESENKNIPTKPNRIKVYIPKNIHLTAELNGSSLLASKVVFKKAKIKTNGCATVGIAAETLDAKISGQGKNFIVMKGGTLKASVSGQGSIQSKGEYSEIEASISGQGSIVSEGQCNGDYDASVSGMGRITHTGMILGRKNKSMSGMGSINL